jgi:hypothetical protein
MTSTALQGLLDLFPEPVVARRGSGLNRCSHITDTCRVLFLPSITALSYTTEYPTRTFLMFSASTILPSTVDPLRVLQTGACQFRGKLVPDKGY